jgi:hypothetical protein
MVDDQIKILFLKLAHERHYEKWLDKVLPALNMKTPRQMLSDNRGEEVIAMLMKLMKGGYIDG